MAKKKSTSSKPAKFTSNPFSNLKGFAASAAEEKPVAKVKREKISQQESTRSFADEMQMLGVQPLSAGNDELEGEESSFAEQLEPVEREAADSVDEDEQFLAAMGELQVRFEEHYPESSNPEKNASARRLKQLKQGKLTPEASLDLHGLTREQVAPKVRFFLQDASYQGYRTLLVITGKGLHSEAGEPVLRIEVERFLAEDGKKWVAEWCRAPKEYGGAGALVLFLRNS